MTYREQGAVLCQRTTPFEDQTSIDWLLENDRNLLTGVVAHNETRERVCR